MGIFIPADNKQPLREVEPENGTDFNLAELYKLLSCNMIEILPLSDGLIMILDEEGKVTGKLRNEQATLIANFVTPKQLIAHLLHARSTGVTVIRFGEPLTDLMRETDYIVGDVLICEKNELR